MSKINSSNPIRIPSASSNLAEGNKTGDSLGNPASPGYSFFGRKAKKQAENSTPASPEPDQTKNSNLISVPEEPPNILRLQVGWEKILLAQKKLCEKTKNLFTLIEAPIRYASAKRSRANRLKSSGCIIDLELKSTTGNSAETKEEISSDEDKDESAA